MIESQSCFVGKASLLCFFFCFNNQSHYLTNYIKGHRNHNIVSLITKPLTMSLPHSNSNPYFAVDDKTVSIVISEPTT